MKSRQETTSLGQIATVTAKLRISDKNGGWAYLSPVWMLRRSNFLSSVKRLVRRYYISMNGMLEQRKALNPLPALWWSYPLWVKRDNVIHTLVSCLIWATRRWRQWRDQRPGNLTTDLPTSLTEQTTMSSRFIASVSLKMLNMDKVFVQFLTVTWGLFKHQHETFLNSNEWRGTNPHHHHLAGPLSDFVWAVN